VFQRPHKEVVRKRLLEPRRFIQILFGPRQVGKTTLITQILEELAHPAHFISADAVAINDQLWIRQQWELARQKSKASGANEYLIVIDEIQKITNWSEIVKKEWDADTRNQLNLKVVILGSSRLLLQKGLTESLAGRFETHYLGHWTFAEMQEAFGWNAEQYVWFGAYPGAAPLVSEPERWKRYVNDALIEASISKDVLMLTRVDKPALLRKLFELGCMYSGQILSYSKILGQLQDAGNTTTLAHYLNLLNTAGLLGGLEKFSPNVIRQRSSSPRFQVHNMALMSAQSPESLQSLRSQPEVWGTMGGVSGWGALIELFPDRTI
jgi:predicted AAA+ superfamily ATPase